MRSTRASGCVGLDRHVHRPGLLHGQEGQHRFRRACHQHGHALAPSGPGGKQVAGERGPAPIQFGIGQTALAIDHGHRVRRALGLALEAFVHQ